MKRTVLVYGLAAGALTAFLRVVEYRFLVVEHAALALIAAGLLP